MELKEIKSTKDGTLFTKKVVEVQSEPSATKKDFVRLKIQNEVFDDKDSLADTTKWVSLLTTLVSLMYDTFTETQKARLPEEHRSLIEYTFAKFKVTNTRADVQFATEGISMVDKILDRQKAVGDIVK